MRWAPAFSLALAGSLVAAARGADLSPAEVAGRDLARQLIESSPAENSSLDGVLKIRAQGRRSEIPVKVQAVPGGAKWEAIYETLPGTNGLPPVKLVVTHHGTNANHYELDGKVIAPEDAAIPFAGTDFTLADLGLDFFHWPQQRVVKKEFRRNCACTVLESVNPTPRPGGYTRVVSWIDQETGGIVQAEAYDGARKLKLFAPKEFKKVNGRWQLQEMQIENVRSDSRTRLEFELSK